MAPIVFGLTTGDARSPLLNFIRDLRERSGKLRLDTTIDFSHTERMFAEGTLLFLAELTRLIRLNKGSANISCILPKNNKVAQVLKQVGILDLLGVTAPIFPQDTDVVHWCTATGQKVLGEKYDDILLQYEGVIAPALADNLYTGITEAMTNVLNHAYDLPRNDGLAQLPTKDWWMFSKEQDGFLTIVFCDLGAGIPRTLPLKRRGLWNKIVKRGEASDSEAIKHAVKDSVSRTKKSYRGKGLRQIVQVTKGVKGGHALVMSNKGIYYIESNSQQRCFNFKDSIMGTLIFWRVPLVTGSAI